MSVSTLTAGMAGGLLFAMMLQGPPATPPMKMGLWETTATTQVKMRDMPAGMPGIRPRVAKLHSCITPENWSWAVATQQDGDGCVRSNVVQTSKSYAFDMSCRGGIQVWKFEMNFDSDTSAHGTMNMQMKTESNFGSADATMKMVFLSSDCGGVAPDKPQVIR